MTKSGGKLHPAWLLLLIVPPTVSLVGGALAHQYAISLQRTIAWLPLLFEVALAITLVALARPGYRLLALLSGAAAFALNLFAAVVGWLIGFHI